MAASLEWRPLCIRGPGEVAIACVPKVAHCAIKHAVLRSYGTDPEKLKRLHLHPALDLCQASDAVAQGYKVFAFVRDPFDRLVSVWANRVMSGRDSKLTRALGTDRGEPFHAFVRRITPGTVRANMHTAPQVDFVPAGATVLRYEAMATEWAKVQAAWPGLPALTAWNVSARAPAADYATEQALAICREAYADDYREFGI
jgi:hypothetical protein